MVSHKSVPALFVLVCFLSVCCSGQLIYKDIQDGAILKVEIDQDYSLEFPVYPNTSFTLKTFSIVIPQNPSGRIISIEGTTTLSHTPDVPCFDYSVRLSDVPEANTLVSTFGPNKGYYYLDLPYSPCSTYILMKPAILSTAKTNTKCSLNLKIMSTVSCGTSGYPKCKGSNDCSNKLYITPTSSFHHVTQPTALAVFVATVLIIAYSLLL